MRDRSRVPLIKVCRTELDLDSACDIVTRHKSPERLSVSTSLTKLSARMVGKEIGRTGGNGIVHALRSWYALGRTRVPPCPTRTALSQWMIDHQWMTDHVSGRSWLEWAAP